jgi:hypothetical protein
MSFRMHTVSFDVGCHGWLLCRKTKPKVVIMVGGGVGQG